MLDKELMIKKIQEQIDFNSEVLLTLNEAKLQEEQNNNNKNVIMDIINKCVFASIKMQIFQELIVKITNGDFDK